VQDVIVFITDDKESFDKKKLFKEAEEAKLAGFRIAAMGVGRADREELKQVASDPSAVVFANSYEDMDTEENLNALWRAMFACKSRLRCGHND
jgi:hypothetical protein